MKAIERLRRQQFASQVATPIALALLSAYEAADLTDPPAGERRTVASFFRAAEDGEGVPEAPVEYVNAEVRRAGVEDFDLRLLELPVDVPEIDRTVSSGFLEMLQTLGAMVWRYRCDLMLLSGRPSRLPAAAATLRETSGLSPHRIEPPDS